MKAGLEAGLGKLEYGPDDSGQGYHIFPYDSDSAIAHVDDMHAASLFTNAPTDLAKLHAALDAVESVCADWEKLADGDRYYASRIRAAIRTAIDG
ncbi:hypothetical protein StoSoilB22_08690 [Arthrobacter sp. StoSoilB22]|nr:hypothetical protein StoSoilB22_08690 [Arthrobacter sp. StoSoilB22]